MQSEPQEVSVSRQRQPLIKPIDLVTNLLEAMKTRNDLDTALVDDVIIATEILLMSRVLIWLKQQLIIPVGMQSLPAQIHRYCAGALDAVNVSAAKVMAGMEDLVCGGGVESLSRVGWVHLEELSLTQRYK